MENHKRLQIITKAFNATDDIEVLVPFDFCKSNPSKIYGKICLTVEGEQLDFNVDIPNEFPLVNGSFSIIFSCSDPIEGFLHQVQGNKICIISPKTDILSEKLHFEIQGLKEWMLKYYINEEEDEHYEYLQYVNHDKKIKTQLLFTDVSYHFQKYDFGFFKYAAFLERLDYWELGSWYQVLFVQSIGNYKCQWATRFHNAKNNQKGLWFYIEEEPIIAPGLIIENWEELAVYFNQKQINFLEQNLKSKQEILYVIIGYNISKSKEQEVHWQLIKVSTKDKPIKQRKRNVKVIGGKIMKQPIHWSKTKNCSYQRFFGRGKLSDPLTDKKILIIGVGAIGSSLAVSLTRGGTKNICLSDFDTIETGNICRSEFLLLQEELPKVIALADTLNSISPFIEVDNFPMLPIGIVKIRPEQKGFSQLKQALSAYDFIFDCSTDMEIAYMLDKMELPATIINLSITNEAKELAVIIGNDIVGDKSRVFNDLEVNEDLIYEGEGCAFPTFRASYIDINALVNFGLLNLDYRINQDNFNAFVIKKKKTISNIQFEIDEY